MKWASLVIVLSVASGARAQVSAGAIRHVVTSHMSEVRYCYAREFARSRGLAVRLSVRFTIGPSGAVQSASVTTGAPRAPGLENCLTKHIRRWRFPAPLGGGTVTVTYPFNLQAAP